MNKVILMGRLSRDPDMRQTPQGTSVIRFNIAVNRRFTGKDGQRQADFIDCTAWRQTAEFISRYFHKGDMIAVVGSLQTRTWDDQNGQRHWATDVVVDEAYFTGSKSSGSGTSDGFAPSQSYAQPQGGSRGGYQQPQAPAYQPAKGPSPNAPTGFDDIDDLGFTSLDGSEDDLPF